MRCSNCDSDNPDGYRFCGNCGALLPIAPASDDSAATTALHTDETVTASATRPGQRSPLFLLAGAAAIMGIACLVFVGCLFLWAFARVSSTSDATTLPTATPESAEDIARIGKVISGGSWEYALTRVDRVKSLTYSDGDTREAKGIWLVVYLTVKNTGKQALALSEEDFGLLDGAQKEYKPSTGFYVRKFITEKQLVQLGEQISPGTPVKTAMFYDISPEIKGLQFLFRQINRVVPLDE